MLGAGAGGYIAPPITKVVQSGFVAEGGMAAKFAEAAANIFEGAIVGVTETIGGLLDKGIPNPLADANGAEINTKPGLQSIPSFAGLLPLSAPTNNVLQIAPNAEIYCVSMCISDYTSSSELLNTKQKK